MGTGYGHRSSAPFLLSAVGWAVKGLTMSLYKVLSAGWKHKGKKLVVVIAMYSVPEKRRWGREYLLVVPILYSCIDAQDLMCRCNVVARPGRTSDNKPERENSIIFLE